MQLRVLRAFYAAGLMQEVGSIVTLPDATAREVIGMGKAEEHKTTETEAAESIAAPVTVAPKRPKKEKP